MSLTQDQIIALINALLPIVAALIGFVLHWYISRLPAAQQAKAEGVVAKVVRAVEQTGAALSAPAKKAQAISLAETLLKGIGLNIPATLLDTLIEDAVYAINLAQTQAANTTPAPIIVPAQPQVQPAPPAAIQMAVPVTTTTGTTTTTTPAQIDWSVTNPAFKSVNLVPPAQQQ